MELFLRDEVHRADGVHRDCLGGFHDGALGLFCVLQGGTHEDGAPAFLPESLTNNIAFARIIIKAAHAKKDKKLAFYDWELVKWPRTFLSVFDHASRRMLWFQT